MGNNKIFVLTSIFDETKHEIVGYNKNKMETFYFKNLFEELKFWKKKSHLIIL